MSSRRLCTCLGLPTLLSWHYCYVHFTHKTSAQLLTCLGSYRPHGRVGFELRRSDPRVHDFDHSAILNPYNLGNPSEFNNILSSLTTSWQCLWSQLQLFSFCLTSKTMILALMNFLCCRAILFHTSVPKVPAIPESACLKQSLSSFLSYVSEDIHFWVTFTGHSC